MSSNEVVERPDHVWQEAVLFTPNYRGENTILMPEDICVVDIEGREPVQPKPYIWPERHTTGDLVECQQLL